MPCKGQKPGWCGPLFALLCNVDPHTLYSLEPLPTHQTERPWTRKYGLSLHCTVLRNGSEVSIHSCKYARQIGPIKDIDSVSWSCIFWSISGFVAIMVNCVRIKWVWARGRPSNASTRQSTSTCRDVASSCCTPQFLQLQSQQTAAVRATRLTGGQHNQFAAKSLKVGTLRRHI